MNAGSHVCHARSAQAASVWFWQPLLSHNLFTQQLQLLRPVMYGWSHLNSKPHQWPITGSLQRLVHHIDQKWPRVRVQNGISSILDIVASRLSLYQDWQSHPKKVNGPSIAYIYMPLYNWNNINTKSLLRIMLGTFELLYECSFNKCWGNRLARCIKHQQVFPATFF